ncbi:glycosyltransferase family 4 protein [Niveispirillum sp. SYP-B3756]|uniref:glycosyltransferase family 4 protein n=1 Tax=Niveispirillum sp. SYP-B3756 TaxID=2662178 RepID=UPI001564AFB0|nr:glycosyltransferase family 4 protein [Niveispirillum sp. SYP-B3756]
MATERHAKKVAFLTPADPESVRTWSGIPYYSLKALRDVFADVRCFPCPIAHNARRVIQRLATPFGIDISREPLISTLYAAEINGRLRRYDPDLIIGVSSSLQLYHRLLDVPTIYVADAVYAGIVDYYPPVGNRKTHNRTRLMGDVQERTALNNSDAVVLCSDWAAKAAHQYYGVPESKINVVPFGANMSGDVDPAFDRQTEVCRLLFVGVDWERKGGPLVHQATELLRSRGIDVELHIVGCRAPIPEAKYVFQHGFLRKSDPADYARLQGLFRSSSLFFMPSQQEAFGIVFAEASAFGLPSVASATGGVPSAVRHGVNGFLLPEGAEAEAYADLIGDLWNDRERYKLLQRESWGLYQRELNWTAWASRTADISDRLFR